jgi:hypothetical protein
MAVASGLGLVGASLSGRRMLHSRLKTLWKQPRLPRAQHLQYMDWSASLSARRAVLTLLFRARSEDTPRLGRSWLYYLFTANAYIAIRAIVMGIADKADRMCSSLWVDSVSYADVHIVGAVTTEPRDN